MWWLEENAWLPRRYMHDDLAPVPGRLSCEVSHRASVDDEVPVRIHNSASSYTPADGVYIDDVPSAAVTMYHLMCCCISNSLGSRVLDI